MTILGTIRLCDIRAMWGILVLVACVACGCSSTGPWSNDRLGRQPDGSFRVSSGQHVRGDAIAFSGRPSDIALHPEKELLAVLSQHEVFLCTPSGPLTRSRAAFEHNADGDAFGAGFHGIVWTGDRAGANWTPDGRRFIVTTDQGWLQEYLFEDHNCTPKERIRLTEDGDKRNAYPGGMCLSRDGATLFVAAAGLNQVVQIDCATRRVTGRYPVEVLPYEVKLSADERRLVVSNWAGRIPRRGDMTAKSIDQDIVVDSRGVPSTGTVSIIDRGTGVTTSVDVGVHPMAIAMDPAHPDAAYVACAMSDCVCELDLSAGRVARAIPIRWGEMKLVGSMPNALAIRGSTMYAACGGDNALAEIDLPTGRVRGFRHAGFYPSAVELSHDGTTAYVLNTKGNGSVDNTIRGNPGSPHDFQGTISVVDLGADIDRETQTVAADNRWGALNAPRPDHPVYNGATKHVLYIIKENQTYDSIFGDMPIGNGDSSLCIMGETVMPNHRKIARDFTLFDNGYVSGTNSADGHAWSTQSIANDYMEHFYVGYRTYPDDGDCPMGLSTGGCIWDAAAAKGKSIRVYGEFCDDAIAEYQPRRPKDWFEAWEDYQSGQHTFQFIAHTKVAGLAPYICPSVHYWPLIQSDQSRADEFIKEFEANVAAGTLPELMILCLPSDHSEGLNPEYPTPRSMQADNDLALGRVVEAVTRSPAWGETIIFGIEDDGQASPDHVDGHRVPYFCISPYSKRGYVDSTLYTTTNMLRSIELILGLDPMTRFDAVAAPITTCFEREPNLSPYVHAPNNVPLGERNPPAKAQGAEYRRWLEISQQQDWSHIDGPDPYWLSRVQWFAYTGGSRPFPATPGQPEGPRVGDADD